MACVRITEERELAERPNDVRDDVFLWDQRRIEDRHPDRATEEKRQLRLAPRG